MANPLVSICIPTRNRARSLRESLKSICAQTYSPLDILISDNASEDSTESVCRELAAADSRIRYVRHAANIGLHGNHNFCMDAARGEYFCIFHDHDNRDVRIVAEYVSFLESHPGVGVVCSDWTLVDDSDSEIGVRDYPVETVTPGLEYIDRTIRSGRSSIGIPGAMVRRAALGAIRFDKDAPIGFGDFPVWFELAERADVGHIAGRLWSWRQNAESHSARTIESIANDYHENLGKYCDAHLVRWPRHEERVRRWRRDIRRFLFWALAYEVALHCQKATGRTPPPSSRSLFEIMDYRLTPQQLDHALDQMKHYRGGAFEHLIFGLVSTLIRRGMTRPLGWIPRYRSIARTILGLE